MNSQPSDPGEPRPFTGRHMAIIMVCFFGIVIAVNFTMARFAVSTFGGTVVDNSYVASQKFNGWLAKADAQQRDGWQQSMQLDSERHLTVTLQRHGTAPADARLSVRANHPLGFTETFTLDMVSLGNGQWRSLAILPEGRWLIHITATQGRSEAQFQGEIR